jgi:hypothetical protein
MAEFFRRNLNKAITGERKQQEVQAEHPLAEQVALSRCPWSWRPTLLKPRSSPKPSMKVLPVQGRNTMLKEIHGHIVNELQQNARTDTVFVVAAVVFNLVVLGINWGVAFEASKGHDTVRNDFILGLLIVGTLLINGFAIRALRAGRTSRIKLLGGLNRMYTDNNVARYYDDDLLGTYQSRYTLFTLVLAVLCVIAIVVPLLVRNLN